MGICQDITIPINIQIPDIFKPGAISAPSITLGTPGITCCNYSFPATSFTAGIEIPGFVAAFMAAAVALEAEIQAALAILDQIHIPICSL